MTQKQKPPRQAKAGLSQPHDRNIKILWTHFTCEFHRIGGRVASREPKQWSLVQPWRPSQNSIDFPSFSTRDFSAGLAGC
jgi:hypothetical protein